MKRLNGVDALMLGMETSKAYMHTFKVAIIDPSTDPDGWSFEKFSTEAERRLHLLPLLRWKYLDSPLGLNHPYWVEDPDFQLEYHVRRVACPPPADHKALCEFMADIYAYQLDRSRPLWMIWVVEGLADGKVALVMLVHHAYVDGVGASWLMQRFYQPQPGVKSADPPPYNPPPLPSRLRRLGWAVRDFPEVAIANLPKVAKGLWSTVMLERKTKASGAPPHPKAGMMRQTPLNITLSAGRTFVCESLPLDSFIAVSKAHNVTINDVFSTCVAGAVRRLLIELGYDADEHALIGATPFAGDRPTGMEGRGNFATQDFCWIRSDIAEPLQRLAASREANLEMKDHIKAVKEAGADISALMQVVPPWGITLIRKAIHRKGGSFGLFGNLVLSNVPGPKDALYLDNWKLDNWFSTGQLADGTGLNITMWSYCGRANVCMLIDREILQDGWQLFGYFVDELTALSAVSETSEVAR